MPKVRPGGRGIVMFEVALPTLDEGLRELLQQVPRAAMTTRSLGSEQAVRLVKATALERLLGLSQR